MRMKVQGNVGMTLGFKRKEAEVSLSLEVGWPLDAPHEQMVTCMVSSNV